MRQVRVLMLSTLMVLLCSLLSQAQQSVATVANGMVPPLIQFSNVATDEGGNSLSGVVSITFSLYNGQQGGEPLWIETQNNVQLDPTGHYSAQLGITKPAGVPTTLFTTGEARWLGVRIAEQVEQPRVLLLSVPYALKAGDAATIGGLPPSAFVKVAPDESTSGNASGAPIGNANAPSATSVGALNSGRKIGPEVKTKNFVAKFINTTGGLGNSLVFDNGTNVGIGTNTPGATLDVNGTVNAATRYNLGGTAFAFGSLTTGNSLLGFAGNTTMTGPANTAVGGGALHNNTSGGNNTAVGEVALFANTATSNNTAIGTQALTNNTAGYSNTAVGVSALGFNSSGFYNIAIGQNALLVNTSGNSNTAIGMTALQENTTANDNTATGYAALYNNNATDNTANGYVALQANTTGVQNTAVGAYALYSNTGGFNNTAIGHGALALNTSGQYNTASGTYALNINTASANTANGYAALFFNTTGSPNTASGAYALYSNSSGTYNTATGYHALYTNSTGTNNTTSGTYTLANNTTGGYNTAMGVSALANNTTGIENTAIGAFACQSNTTGSGLNCFGYNSAMAAPNLRNATAIGAHATVSVSNALVLGSVAGVNGATATTRVGIGTASPTNLLTLGQGFGPSISDGWATYSSRRWKTNIQTLHGALGKVEQLRGVSYDLKANGQHEVGVIAEEVGAVVPELVTYEENGKDARGVDYSRLTALLIEATKEQQALIRHQQKLIRAQQTQISQLVSQVQTIQVSLSSGRPAGFEVRTASVRTTPRQ